MSGIARRACTLSVLLLLAVAILACAAPVTADDTMSITDLTDHMNQYDGKTVTVQGEVVGDIMDRGEYAWITVNDDSYSEKSIREGADPVGVSNMGIGVWLSKTETEDISITGGFKNKGDTVNVTGVFHRACHQHGGDTDIHATGLEIAEKGYRFPFHLSYWKLSVVVVLAGIAALLLYLWLERRKKSLSDE